MTTQTQTATGPWRVTDEFIEPRKYNCLEVVSDYAEKVIARVYDCNDAGTGYQDAALIASAPDLLAALKDVLDTYQYDFENDCKNLDPEDRQSLVETWGRAEAAIAKAEGR